MWTDLLSGGNLDAKKNVEKFFISILLRNTITKRVKETI